MSEFQHEIKPNGESTGEAAVIKMLNWSGIEREKTFDGILSEKGFPLRFDFYIHGLNGNFLIEIDGRQHDGKTRKSGFGDGTRQRDVIKNAYCLEHNITLYRVPFAGHPNIVVQIVRTILHKEGISTKQGKTVDGHFVDKMIVTHKDFQPLDDKELLNLASGRFIKRSARGPHNVRR